MIDVNRAIARFHNGRKTWMPKNNRRHKAEKDLFVLSSSKDSILVETRHQQIVEGACRLFFKKGFHPTTIREIAKECGMSIGQLYHYISSKDDVLFLVHKYFQRIWLERLEYSGTGKIKDPIEMFVTSLQQTLQYVNENRKLFQFLYSETKYLNKERLTAVLEMDAKNYVGSWNKLLENVNQKTPIKVDQYFAANLITFVSVFLALRGWNLKDRPQQENIDFLIDFILRGLGITKSKTIIPFLKSNTAR